MASGGVSVVRIFSSRIICGAGAFSGEIAVENGRIAHVEPCGRASAGAVDWSGDDLIPGLVDIHTDNLEKHFMPRPGAIWDGVGAALAHDAQVAGAGVTTVLEALSFTGGKNGLDREMALAAMIAGLDAAKDALRIDHRLHLRCQGSTPTLQKLMAPYIDNPNVQMLSIMDRRRDIASLERNADALRREGVSDAEIAADFAKLSAGQDWEATPLNRQHVAEVAFKIGVPLASHDDTTAEDVDLGAFEGATICEYPMTRVAADRARECGMTIVMGGPNFVRGGSYTGNLSAREVAEAGLLDVLCSDYIPQSMLRAAYMLMDEPFAWEPSRAIATVTANAAACAGLADRGDLKPGLCADFVRVRRGQSGWPAAREVWRLGRRVA